ncbi:MAG: sigma 54-interacting transcriptional regulator [Treponemataceae bacterium]|nr:sigma 54-interacting transcriptional regulator [Treponemataceae bacterium]
MNEICVLEGPGSVGCYYGMLAVWGMKVRVFSELQPLLQAVALQKQVSVLVECAAMMQYGEELLPALAGTEKKTIGLICSDDTGESLYMGDRRVAVVNPAAGAASFLEQCRQLEHSRPEHIPLELEPRPSFGELDRFIGVSPARDALLSQVQKYAAYDIPLLFTGEPGVGKSFLAELTASVYSLRRKIQASREGRSAPDMPFVTCPVITYSSDTMESTLFGHVQGAFTGAVADHEGKIAAAGNGTLFLDEAGDIPLSVQPKLLQFLQSRTYSPMGSNRVYTSSARIISATNKDLLALLESGDIRKDFLDRIAGKVIRIPSLNERLEDIPVLARYFLEKTNARWGTDRKLDDRTVYRMLEISWKDSNVRVLEKLIMRMIIESDGQYLTPDLVDQCFINRF